MTDQRDPAEPDWCNSWTSHDDITGEGQQTFEHECGQVADHDGDHTCMGHVNDWDGSHSNCTTTWHNYKNRRSAS